MAGAFQPLGGQARRLGEQGGELHDAALPGFERFAVLAIDRAEADMLEHAAFREPGELGRQEYLFEVELLPLIHDIQNPLRSKARNAVEDRGEIGRCIERRAIGFREQQRRRGPAAFGGDFDHQRAIARLR